MPCRRRTASLVSVLVAVALAGCSSGSSSPALTAVGTAPSSTAPSAPAPSSTATSSTATSSTATSSTATSTTGPSTTSPPPSDVPAVPDGWVADEVTVATVLGTIAGTWTHPRSGPSATPAALIIGGSGPTDRDGNSAGSPDVVDNLRTLANWLAVDGVATLRTDKPGSGETGAGNLTASTAADITVDDYLTMNAQLLAFVAARPGVDTAKISVVGHSEGGLFAVLLAAGRHGAATNVPVVHAIAALEPQSLPILDILSTQVTDQVHAAASAGRLTAAQADALLGALAAAITATRSGAALPADLPTEIAPLFSPSVLTYLRTEDAVDPRAVAASLPAGLPALLSCSDADIQVACSDVTQLGDAATAAGAGVTLIHLTDVAHTLKVDPSRSAAQYGADLPFSPELRQALATWAGA